MQVTASETHLFGARDAVVGGDGRAEGGGHLPPHAVVLVLRQLQRQRPGLQARLRQPAVSATGAGGVVQQRACTHSHTRHYGLTAGRPTEAQLCDLLDRSNRGCILMGLTRSLTYPVKAINGIDGEHDKPCQKQLSDLRIPTLRLLVPTRLAIEGRT